MPERWETQIRSCARSSRPKGYASGCPRTTRRAAIPPRRRVAAAVTAFVVFAAAAVLVVRALTPTGAPDATGEGVAAETLTLELLASDGAPAATLRYGDQTQAGVRGLQVVLRRSCVAGIADFTIYPPVWEYVVVPPGTPIGASGAGTLAAPRDRPRRRADLQRRRSRSPTPTACTRSRPRPRGRTVRRTSSSACRCSRTGGGARRPARRLLVRTTDDRNGRGPRSRTDSTSRSAARRATRASRS